MQRILAVGYALVAYLIFFATFLWLIAFLADLAIFPTTVNSAIDGAPLAEAILIDLSLIALFGLQHSIMARPAFQGALDQDRPCFGRTIDLCRRRGDRARVAAALLAPD